MATKLSGPMATVVGLLAIPVIAGLLYGGYIVFTYKAKPRPPEPKIITFRADGKPKNEAKKGAAKKKSDEPEVWDVELIWEVENSADITIDQGIGKVDAKASKHVEISKNTTYVMKAKNESGEVTYSLDVDVMPAPQ